jgi:hypothetical protein
LRWSCKHFGRKNPCKKSTQGKVVYYKETFLQGSTKPRFTTQNWQEISWKKSPLFIACFFWPCSYGFYGVLPPWRWGW